MNLLAWLLSLSVLVLLLVQAVTFHKATVCRQEAWLKSTELRTRLLLTDPKQKEREWHLGCRIQLLRDGGKITWRSSSSFIGHSFALDLEGRL